jgi:predicted ATPase
MVPPAADHRQEVPRIVRPCASGFAPQRALVRRGMNVSAGASVILAIGSRHLLLILVNCEYVIDAPADLAETILRLCLRVTMLATSGEAPRSVGEYVYRVPPLAVLRETFPSFLLATRRRSQLPG